MMQLEGLEEALRSLGAVLESRQLTYRLLVAGGSSLLLLGFIDRTHRRLGRGGPRRR